MVSAGNALGFKRVRMMIASSVCIYMFLYFSFIKAVVKQQLKRNML